MGRFSIEKSLNNPQQNLMQPNGQPMSPAGWPTQFPKESIGIDRNGVIVEDKQIFTPGDITIIPDSLEAIRTMRLKGYKVFLFFNEPLIGQGRLTPEDVEKQNQHLMNVFGQAGIFSIDGLLYSTTDNKQDIYSLPNTGMLKKAENEFRQKFKGGYFVGNKIIDLKAADSIGARPVFIKTGDCHETEPKLNTFANKELKAKTKTYNTLLEFANFLS
jgi:D-glycero-D-manno-heptose 1,7-bisphosphate phosphatase